MNPPTNRVAGLIEALARKGAAVVNVRTRLANGWAGASSWAYTRLPEILSAPYAEICLQAEGGGTCLGVLRSQNTWEAYMYCASAHPQLTASRLSYMQEVRALLDALVEALREADVAQRNG